MLSSPELGPKARIEGRIEACGLMEVILPLEGGGWQVGVAPPITLPQPLTSREGRLVGCPESRS
jgi:hypothetical protein